MASSALNREINEVMNVYTDLLNEVKDQCSNIDNSVDKGFINVNTGASFAIRSNGSANMASGLMAQYKTTSDGHIIEQSVESNTTTVRKVLDTDEMIINQHKFNPAFYEYTDMKEMFGNQAQAIGNLTVNTTVLVKAWEPSLKKWVLIRRPARFPMFSPRLNISDAPENMDIDSNISDEIMNSRKGANNQ